jgi:hypothetical protein
LQSAPNHGFELIHTFLFLFLSRKGTYRKQPNISIDTLFDFFKTLNQNPTNDGDGATVLPEIDEDLVNNLNI